MKKYIFELFCSKFIKVVEMICFSNSRKMGNILSYFGWRLVRYVSTVEDICRQSPNWRSIISQIDTAEKWKIVQSVMFADKRNERYRFFVFNTAFQDVLDNLHKQGKQTEVLQIMREYFSFLNENPRFNTYYEKGFPFMILNSPQLL